MTLFDPYAALDEIDRQAAGTATSATSATLQLSNDFTPPGLAEAEQEIRLELEAHMRLGLTSGGDPQAVSQNIVSFDAWLIASGISISTATNTTLEIQK